MINKTGIFPVEYRVLVQLDVVESKSTGGIILPDELVAKEQFAQTEALLIAVGGLAFERWIGEIPKPGDTLIIRKYAAHYTIKGEDGKTYQLCNDKDISAIVRKDNE